MGKAKPSRLSAMSLMTSPDRAATETRAPFSARVRVMAAPIPREAPVTSTWALVRSIRETYRDRCQVSRFRIFLEFFSTVFLQVSRSIDGIVMMRKDHYLWPNGHSRFTLGISPHWDVVSPTHIRRPRRISNVANHVRG